MRWEAMAAGISTAAPGLPHSGGGYSGYGGVALIEIFYTFMLCFVVLNVACTTMNEKSRRAIARSC